MSIWDKKTSGNRAVDEVLSGVKNYMSANRFATKEVASATLSLESLRDDQVNAILAAKDSLSLAIESLSNKIKPTAAQVKAATIAGLVAGDVRSFLEHPVIADGKEGVMPTGGEYTTSRGLSLENYDESANKNAASYSVTYNMLAARQDEFGEAFFPTMTLSPDQIGFNATIRILSVFDDEKHKTTGSLTRFNNKNLLRAYADATILKNEMTRIIPVFRAGAEDNFVAVTLIPSRDISLEGESVKTSPLKIGATVNLIGLSQTDSLLASGMMDFTDTIDPSILLSKVYIKIGDDVVSFDTKNLPLNAFIQTGQSYDREMHLNFRSDSMMMNKGTTKVDGSALVTLDAIKNSDLIVRLSVNLSGLCATHTGETSVYGNAVRVHSVSNAGRELIALDTGAGKTIVDAFAASSIIGYDLSAFRANANRRQRGQLINTTYFTQPYSIALLSPISAARPVTVDSANDASDLAALITSTNIRASNMAVTKLIEAANFLADYIDTRDGNMEPPEVLGVSRYLIKPVYQHETLDVSSVINSLTSTDRVADLRAAILNKLQNMVYNMWRDSQYQAAATTMNGGVSPTPTIIIGTDPVIAQYLMTSGDLRTLGGEFNVRTVTSLDTRVAGKIFMAFGDFSGGNNAEFNPLHFGNMLWKPELTLVMPISRNGQVSKELTVSPSFVHIVNVPILAVIEIEGITDSLNRVPLNVHNV